MNRYNVYIKFPTFGFSDEANRLLVIPQTFFCKTVLESELDAFVDSIYRQMDEFWDAEIIFTMVEERGHD